MSIKYVLHYSQNGLEKDYEVEDFTDAIVCEGYVFFRDRIEHPINTAPGQCWGEYVDVSAGSFVDGQLCQRDTTLCIDDVGQSHVVTEIVSLQPLKIQTSLHIGVGYPACWEDDAKDKVSHHIAKLNLVQAEDYLAVGDFCGAEHTLLIPAEFKGSPLRYVDLRSSDLSNVETLIISEGVKELAMDFKTADKLRRLQIPDSIHLLCPLDEISCTPWFRAQRPEPIYISDCYCGTPGGGSGGVRSLCIPEGITSVAAAADFHSYWHSIKTPESLRSIGYLAFATCHCLEDLNLADGIFRIGREAFHTTPRLKSLYLPDSLRFLGPDCFHYPDYLQSVSVPSEELADLFCVHSITIRGKDGDRHISKCPPFVVTLSDRINSFPPRSPFTAAGKEYKSTDELAHHPLEDFGFEYLDVYGRKLWRIAARDDCRYGTDGDKLLVERWFFKTDSGITQVEKTVDGTVLVRDDINILDVDYAVRSHAAREVFGL